jgi:hypothetical protein
MTDKLYKAAKFILFLSIIIQSKFYPQSCVAMALAWIALSYSQWVENWKPNQHIERINIKTNTTHLNQTDLNDDR